MKIRKITVTDKLAHLDLSELEGDIKDVTNKLLVYQVNKNYNKIWISTDKDYGYGDDDPSYSFDIYGERVETDEEFQKRKDLIEKGLERERKRQEAIKKSKEERDRKNYERLKAKFENTKHEKET